VTLELEFDAVKEKLSELEMSYNQTKSFSSESDKSEISEKELEIQTNQLSVSLKIANSR
jgi:hypothetical protein